MLPFHCSYPTRTRRDPSLPLLIQLRYNNQSSKAVVSVAMSMDIRKINELTKQFEITCRGIKECVR